MVYNNINEFNIINDVKNKQIKFKDFDVSTYSNEASFLLNYSGPNSNIYQTFDTFSLSNIIDTKNYNLCSPNEDDDWMDKYIDKNNPLYSFFGNEKPI